MKNLAVMYHYVRPREWSGIHPLEPKLFEEQLNWLLKQYEIVEPNGLLEPACNSKPRCVITFDDATKDQYEYAFPILKRKGIPAYFTFMSGIFEKSKVPVVHLTHAALSFFSDEEIWEELNKQFVLSDVSQKSSIYHYEQDLFRRYNKYALNFALSEEDSRLFLESKVLSKFSSWSEFIDMFYISMNEWRELIKAGMTVGVHAVDHRAYSEPAERFLKEEIIPCKQYIREHFGIVPEWYTPAFGGGPRYMEMIQNLQPFLKAEGFKGGFTTISGYNEQAGEFWFNRFDCNKVPPVGNLA
ncbi:Polysaccharide deacetylase [compost metagenome]